MTACSAPPWLPPLASLPSFPCLPVCLSIPRLFPHRDYPRLPEGAKPLEGFVAAANSLGGKLSGDQQEGLMGELGKAMTKSSLLLVPLAREA